MHLYTTLPLVIGAASALQKQQQQQQLLPWHHAAQINDMVSYKAAKTRNVADTLNRHLEDLGGLFGNDTDWEDLGIDFGDLGMSFCGGDEELMDANLQCTCSIQSGDLVLMDMATIIANFDVIMEEGVDVGFDCKTLAPECYMNECGKVLVTCNMTLDFTMMEMDGSMMNCSACVEYTNGDGDYPEEGIMEGQTLCASLELCPIELDMTTTTSRSTSDVLCGCNATLNDKECTCSICDNDMGIELDCGDFVSECTDTGFEMSGGNSTNARNATSFLPQFQQAASPTSAAAATILSPLAVSGLMMAFALA